MVSPRVLIIIRKREPARIGCATDGIVTNAFVQVSIGTAIKSSALKDLSSQGLLFLLLDGVPNGAIRFGPTSLVIRSYLGECNLNGYIVNWAIDPQFCDSRTRYHRGAFNGAFRKLMPCLIRM